MGAFGAFAWLGTSSSWWVGTPVLALPVAVLGLAVPGIVLDDVGATTKTMADFPGLWAGLVTA